MADYWRVIRETDPAWDIADGFYRNSAWYHNVYASAGRAQVPGVVPFGGKYRVSPPVYGKAQHTWKPENANDIAIYLRLLPEEFDTREEAMKFVEEKYS